MSKRLNVRAIVFLAVSFVIAAVTAWMFLGIAEQESALQKVPIQSDRFLGVGVLILVVWGVACYFEEVVDALSSLLGHRRRVR
jgi:hypothetical protein